MKRKSRDLSAIGQSMVEFAFVLPIFLGMVFAIIEIGRAWAAKQSLTIAAREGSRVLVMPYGGGLSFSTEADAQTEAVNRTTSYLNSSGIKVGGGTQIGLVRVRPGNDSIFGTGDDVLEHNYSNGRRGDRVGIRIVHNFETPLPLILSMFHDPYAQNPQPNGPTSITMGVTCFMDHE